MLIQLSGRRAKNRTTRKTSEQATNYGVGQRHAGRAVLRRLTMANSSSTSNAESATLIISPAGTGAECPAAGGMQVHALIGISLRRGTRTTFGMSERSQGASKQTLNRNSVTAVRSTADTVALATTESLGGGRVGAAA